MTHRIVMACVLIVSGVSTGASQWTPANEGLTDPRVRALVVRYSTAGSDTTLAAGTDEGVFISTNKGEIWTAANNDLPALPNITCMAVRDTTIFIGTFGNGVWRSTNAGTSWFQTQIAVRQLAINALLVSDSNLFAGASNYMGQNPGGVFRTTDNGGIWASAGIPTGYVRALALCDTFLFVGTRDGVFRSSDNGGNWIPTDLVNVGIAALVADGRDLYAGSSNGIVMRSTDHGLSWTQVSTDLPSLFILTLAVVSGNVFAGSDSGRVFISKNGGSWRAEYISPPGTYVRAFAVSGVHCYAGTDGGIWRRPLPDVATAVSSDPVAVPGTLALDQNFPNPCNPGTTIRYGLPRASNVKLEVFNTLGQRVEVLQDGEQEAGYHEVRFDATHLSSGLYYYRLRAGVYLLTKKLCVVK